MAMLLPSLLPLHFMLHDKWEDVLFLHWKVPPELEPLLESCSKPFRLDKTKTASHDDNDGDGSCWIGLVFLTERNVGPYFLRPVTCVTHHGLNVRTYLRNNAIHFSSLECNSLFATMGGNLFGIPYKFGTITRQRNQDFFSLSTIRSVGWKIWNFVLSIFSKRTNHNNGSSFSVACEWERTRRAPPSKELAKFFVERYVLYTRKYGINWRGEISHEEWPVEEAVLKKLNVVGINHYQPKNVQPLIAYMASKSPDSVLFSPGVGPIHFRMLRPTWSF